MVFVNICVGSSCHLKGSEMIVRSFQDEIEANLEIEDDIPGQEADMPFDEDETLTDEEAEVNQEEEIVERVKEIYAAVKRRKTSADFVKLEQQYTTRAWRKALKAVSEKDAQSEDEVGFFDFDYWSMSQDDGDLKIKKVKVASIDAEKGVATVTLELHNYGTVTPLELSMRYEDDSWRINNFNSLLQEMDEYVKGK